MNAEAICRDCTGNFRAAFLISYKERGGALKRLITTLMMIVLLLVACTEKEKPLVEEKKEAVPEVKEEVIEKLRADSAEFHFVANWLSDTEIVFVEKNDGVYYVKSYDVENGEVSTLYQDESIIVDVMIHPLGEQLLVHTTDNPTSGTVKTISLAGVVQHEVVIQSAELEIEWNDKDPSLILITAFYEDWTFDLFAYNGSNKDLRLLPIENPFPKWLGRDGILFTDLSSHPLDGGDLLLYNLLSGEQKKMEIDHVIYYDTYEDAALVMQIEEDEKMTYNVINEDQTVLYDWEMPAVSNYSEWMMPEIDWISSKKLLITASENGGQQDELEAPYQLIQVTEGEQDVLADEMHPGVLKCAPNGEKCLTGQLYDHYLDLKKNKEIQWLSLDK